MARQRSHRSRRRRRGRFSGLYVFVSVLIVTAALIAAAVVFFRVQDVTVEGNSHYTQEEVVKVSGIKTGDNLIAIPKGKIASAIRTYLPYVESVSIKRKLPDGVRIIVRERKAAASIHSADGRWLISSQGKLLEPAGDQNVVQIEGLTAAVPYPGDTVQVAEENQATLDYVLSLLTVLENRDLLADCRTIDCSSGTFLRLEWRIYELKLPRDGDYDAMMRMLLAALDSDKMPKDEPGTFDFTVAEGEVYFRRSK